MILIYNKWYTFNELMINVIIIKIIKYKNTSYNFVAQLSNV